MVRTVASHEEALLLGCPSVAEVTRVLVETLNMEVETKTIWRPAFTRQRPKLVVTKGAGECHAEFDIFEDEAPHADAPYDGRVTYVLHEGRNEMCHEILAGLAKSFGGWTRRPFYERYAHPRAVSSDTIEWLYHEGADGNSPALRAEISLNSAFGHGAITQSIYAVMGDPDRLDAAIAILTTYRAATGNIVPDRMPGSGARERIEIAQRKSREHVVHMSASDRL
jgi:hypothetical protein